MRAKCSDVNKARTVAVLGFLLRNKHKLLLPRCGCSFEVQRTTSFLCDFWLGAAVALRLERRAPGARKKSNRCCPPPLPLFSALGSCAFCLSAAGSAITALPYSVRSLKDDNQAMRSLRLKSKIAHPNTFTITLLLLHTVGAPPSVRGPHKLFWGDLFGVL